MIELTRMLNISDYPYYLVFVSLGFVVHFRLVGVKGLQKEQD